MDWQQILNFAVIAAVGVIGWLGRELWTAVKDLRKDLTAIEVALPTSYVKKDEFKDGLQEIKTMLEKISDKLDGKADKS